MWLLVLLAFGAGGMVFGEYEMASLTAVAGLFVAAQAADADERWRTFYRMIAWIVPLGGATAFLGLGALIYQSDLQGPLRSVVLSLMLIAVVGSLLTALRPISNTVARLMFQGETSHTNRLAARLILFGLMIALPSWLAFREVLPTLLDDSSTLFENVSLGGGLIGYVVLALASVGLAIRRNLVNTLGRLGIQPLSPRHLAVMAIGVGGLYTLNSGADALQRAFFPELWASDHRVNEMLAGHLTVAQTLLLGLSAGVGEEITLRGALQPKLGLLMTSLLFAALHVQYSWFGMIVILLLGLLLGWIRARTSTSVAMGVHVLYDVAAVFSI